MLTLENSIYREFCKTRKTGIIRSWIGNGFDKHIRNTPSNVMTIRQPISF